MSKLCSVERIREYLEQELGPELLMKVYPIIKDFGDDILFMDKIQDLKDQLKHLLSGAQVDKYHITFSTLVFYELEIEKNSQAKSSQHSSVADRVNGHRDQEYDPQGMLNAINCFKDVAATATFGKVGLGQTIGKRR